MSISTPQTTPRAAWAVLALTAVILLGASGLATPGASAADSINIYRNAMNTAAAAKKVRQYSKATCSRKGSTKALRVKVGAKTAECVFGLPVVGRDLTASITARLFKSGSKQLLKRSWVAVNVRQAKDGSRYQFAVLPQTGRFSLRKIASNGKIKYLATGLARKTIRPVDRANRITVRAYNGVGSLPKTTARVLGVVNGRRVALFDDVHGAELSGRDTTISIGSKTSARGAFGSFMGAQVAMPDPY